MRRLALLVFVLCSCATSCNHEDTDSPEKWPRTTEARVTGAEWTECSRKPPAGDRVVSTAQCRGEEPPLPEYCDNEPPSYRKAVRMLTRQPQCIEEAVTSLRLIAGTDKTALSDLAAAYYTRAQREDRASDLLQAFESASQAVERFPSVAAARFNLALAQEAIGLDEEALATWKSDRDNGPWSAEARAHETQLERIVAETAGWDDVRVKDALAAGDLRIVDRFPRAAVQYLEDLQNSNPAAIERLARQLTMRLQNDPYPQHVAAAAARNANGHAAYMASRQLEIELKHLEARAAYARASELLRRGGSPLYLESERRRAIALRFVDPKEAMDILATIESEARRTGYEYLLHRIIATRGHVLFRLDRFLESLAAYESTKAYYAQLRDFENLADVHAANAGTYRVMGHNELAWRELLRGLPSLRRTVNSTTRHKFDGEMALTATDLEQPRFALLRQKSRVATQRARLAAAKTPQNEMQLAVALRELARIEFRAGNYVSGRTDIAEAIRLREPDSDEKQKRQDADTKRMLDLREAQVSGEGLLATDLAAAADEFTRALSHVQLDEYSSFRAEVLVQRATAFARMGRQADSERDLAAALATLRKEEQQQLAGRKRDEGEPLWSSYFSRFDDAYRMLVAQLIESGRKDEAFQYAERARAFELLDRVRKQAFAPPDFLRMTEGDNPIRVADLQQRLPPGTFLLQYCVTSGRVYTLIVSRNAFDVVSRAASRDALELRSANLRDAGKRELAAGFDAASKAVYDQVLSEPMAKVRELNGDLDPQRLVIVPDHAMHGLPFAALRNPMTGKYLVEETTIETAPSATLYVLALMRSAELAHGELSALLVGDPQLDRTLPLTQGLDRLGFSEPEARDISKGYEPRVDMLTGPRATIPAFFDLAPDKAVIHFAGHSIVSPQAPWSSMLLFAPAGDDHGVLAADGLLALKLDRTRLVVLGACSSAGGFPVGAEGAAPLVRSFIANGVPAVVGTLWDVRDATALKVFVSFHQDYRNRGDAAAALRAAQLELLRDPNPRLSSPTAWGPFQVVGH